MSVDRRFLTEKQSEVIHRKLGLPDGKLGLQLHPRCSVNDEERVAA